jgi:ribosomal protein S18 acetylase RimI-like enzyme
VIASSSSGAGIASSQPAVTRSIAKNAITPHPESQRWGISQLSVEGIRDESGRRSGIQYSRRMSVEVEAVGQVTGELVEAVGRLLSQLSSSAGPLSADGLARIATHDATTLFVARSQSAIVGMLTLVTFPLPSGLRARIEDVVVDQAVRGQGIGTALTNAALRLAQQQGARSVDLTSRPSRVAANRLYQQLGFQLRDSNVYRHQPGAGAEEGGSRGR